MKTVKYLLILFAGILMSCAKPPQTVPADKVKTEWSQKPASADLFTEISGIKVPQAYPKGDFYFPTETDTVLISTKWTNIADIDGGSLTSATGFSRDAHLAQSIKVLTHLSSTVTGREDRPKDETLIRWGKLTGPSGSIDYIARYQGHQFEGSIDLVLTRNPMRYGPAFFGADPARHDEEDYSPY